MSRTAITVHVDKSLLKLARDTAERDETSNATIYRRWFRMGAEKDTGLELPPIAEVKNGKRKH